MSWKRRPEYFLVLGLIVVISPSTRAVILIRDWLRGSPLTLGELWFGVFGIAITIVMISVIGFELAWSKVSLTDVGVEVRRFRTVVYPYRDIRDALIDRSTNDRRIQIVLSDSRRIQLPAPTRGLKKVSKSELPDAIHAIRDHAGLGPAQRPLP